MCPSEALTMYWLPKYLPIVFAFAGDSTMTSDLAILDTVNNLPRHFYKVSARKLPNLTEQLQIEQGRNHFG